MPVTWLGDTGPLPYVPVPAPTWPVGAVARLGGAVPVEAHPPSALLPRPRPPARAAEAYRAVAEGTAGGGEAATRRLVFEARDVMTAGVATLSPDATLEEARRLVAEKRFRHVPVTASDGRILGILSDRDLLRGRPNPDHRRRAGPAAGEPRLVADLMSTELFTATPDTPLREIAQVMVERRVGALPILDERHRVVGVVTTTDVLRCVMTHPALELWA